MKQYKLTVLLSTAIALTLLGTPDSLVAQDSPRKLGKLFNFGKQDQKNAQREAKETNDGLVSREVPANSPSGGEGSITIPMSDYQDLIRRLERLESKVAANNSSPSETYSSTSFYDGGKAPAKAPAKAVHIPERGGLYGNFEYVYAKPVFSKAPAFFIHDTNLLAPEGAEEVPFDPDLQSSYRFEVGYLQPAGDLGWRARYWFFDGDDTQRSPNNVDVKIGVADDPDIGIDDVGTGTDDYYIASMRTELDVLDLDMFSTSTRENGLRRPKHQISGVGLRLASIEHQYRGQTVDITGGTGNRLESDHDFSGLGPSVFFETKRPVGNTPFTLNLKTRGGLLFGQGDTQYITYNAPTGPASDFLRTKDKMVIIPVAEIQAGVGYDFNWGRRVVTLEGGVEAQAWFNGGTPIIAGQDSSSDSDSYTNAFSEDMGFIGGYFKLGFEF